MLTIYRNHSHTYSSIYKFDKTNETRPNPTNITQNGCNSVWWFDLAVLRGVQCANT